LSTTIMPLPNLFNGSLKGFLMGARLVGYFCKAGLEPLQEPNND